MSKPVLVTTKHRGVFFGYMDGEPDTLPDSAKLTNCRNVVYWSADTKGFLGLAAHGPSGGCRIGPPADVTLYDVTSVADVTEAAVRRFEDAPWK